MGALVFGTLIGFGLSVFLVNGQEQQKIYGIPENWYETHRPQIDPSNPNLTQDQIDQLQKGMQPTRSDCVQFTRTANVVHTERIWWMLPLNPFVVVADAAPSTAHKEGDPYAAGFTPMRWISIGARAARNGPDEVSDECTFQTAIDDSQVIDSTTDRALSSSPVWPYGLGFLLVGGAGATWVASRRLRTPIRRLPNGTRIA
jgi:hypothetical protein